MYILIHVGEIVIFDGFMEVERCFVIFPGIKILLYYRLINVSSSFLSVSLFSFPVLLSSPFPSPPSLPSSQKRCCFIEKTAALQIYWYYWNCGKQNENYTFLREVSVIMFTCTCMLMYMIRDTVVYAHLMQERYKLHNV